jgi:hypothetical protein
MTLFGHTFILYTVFLLAMIYWYAIQRITGCTWLAWCVCAVTMGAVLVARRIKG